MAFPCSRVSLYCPHNECETERCGKTIAATLFFWAFAHHVSPKSYTCSKGMFLLGFSYLLQYYFSGVITLVYYRLAVSLVFHFLKFESCNQTFRFFSFRGLSTCRLVLLKLERPARALSFFLELRSIFSWFFGPFIKFSFFFHRATRCGCDWYFQC